jgi:hypothetical protein
MSRKSSIIGIVRFIEETYNSIFIKLLSLKPKNNFWQVSVLNVDTKQSIFVAESNERIWYADPFLFQNETDTFLFVEYFDSEFSIGRIGYSKLGPGGFEEFTICLEEAFHLSFPRICLVNQEIFMTVESSSQKGIRIYKSIHFPDSWRLLKVINNFNYFKDPILIAENNAFYLLASSKDLDLNLQMQLFSSSDICTDHWPKSEINLVARRRNYFRNGGLIDFPDKYILVQQIPKFGIYGFDIELLEIVKPINLNNFVFLPAKNNIFIKPKDIIQFHTLNSVGNFITYDFKK